VGQQAMHIKLEGEYISKIIQKSFNQAHELTDCASSMSVNGRFGRYVWFCRFAHSQKRWNWTGMPNSLATSSCLSHGSTSDQIKKIKLMKIGCVLNKHIGKH